MGYLNLLFSIALQAGHGFLPTHQTYPHLRHLQKFSNFHLYLVGTKAVPTLLDYVAIGLVDFSIFTGMALCYVLSHELCRVNCSL
jgi:hypothetical protein